MVSVDVIASVSVNRPMNMARSDAAGALNGQDPCRTDLAR
ncbi:hypothetical protein HMPREF1162_1309 [ [[Propionibacterium] namnetense SK182B-JCVI]|uniref:Uncharacterized protein n=1 Tax=[Propionibacterium] namnetense SK182B-JCVI TaxID=1051006 RepID=F9NUV0_9ACTN|nr:hypothetical protein HMPREF1162_1309 [ [[Propionibacterium] namnetense SK182B-JCVI]